LSAKYGRCIETGIKEGREHIKKTACRHIQFQVGVCGRLFVPPVASEFVFIGNQQGIVDVEYIQGIFSGSNLLCNLKKGSTIGNGLNGDFLVFLCKKSACKQQES